MVIHPLRNFFTAGLVGLLFLLAGCRGTTDSSDRWSTDFLSLGAGHSLRIMVNSGSLIIGSQISDTDTVSLASGGGLELALGQPVASAWPLTEVPVKSITVATAIAATSATQVTAAVGDPLPLSGVVLSYAPGTQEVTLVLPSFGLSRLGLIAPPPLHATENLKYHRFTLRLIQQTGPGQWSYVGTAQRWSLGPNNGPGALEQGSGVEGYLKIIP